MGTATAAFRRTDVAFEGSETDFTLTVWAKSDGTEITLTNGWTFDHLGVGIYRITAEDVTVPAIFTVYDNDTGLIYYDGEFDLTDSSTDIGIVNLRSAMEVMLKTGGLMHVGGETDISSISLSATVPLDTSIYIKYVDPITGVFRIIAQAVSGVHAGAITKVVDYFPIPEFAFLYVDVDNTANTSEMPQFEVSIFFDRVTYRNKYSFRIPESSDGDRDYWFVTQTGDCCPYNAGSSGQAVPMRVSNIYSIVEKQRRRALYQQMANYYNPENWNEYNGAIDLTVAYSGTINTGCTLDVYLYNNYHNLEKIAASIDENGSVTYYSVSGVGSQHDCVVRVDGVGPGAAAFTPGDLSIIVNPNAGGVKWEENGTFIWNIPYEMICGGSTYLLRDGNVTMGVSNAKMIADEVCNSSTRTLALKGITVTATDTNANGVTITGNGTGKGISVTGGAEGSGVILSSGANDGDGLQLSGNSSGLNVMNGALGSAQFSGTVSFDGASQGSAIYIGGANADNPLISLQGVTAQETIKITAALSGTRWDAATLTELGAAVRDVNNTSPAPGSLGEAVNTGGAAVDLSGIPAAVDAQLSSTHGSGSWGVHSGEGADHVTLTVVDANSNPVADAEVWITSDEDGTTVVAGPLVTEDDGTVEFFLDAGLTYYCWRKKSGYNFTNPLSFVAVGD